MKKEKIIFIHCTVGPRLKGINLQLLIGISGSKSDSSDG